ncbi:hypothetical protein N8Z97_00940 [Gammaproteobacteria bacterium]|nr:hypothetical protein [Gammaproteobacteria bacterium]
MKKTVTSKNNKKQSIVVMLVFSLFGCDKSIDAQAEDIELIFTCTCQANKSSGNMCTYTNGVNINIDKSSNNISFFVMDDSLINRFDNLQTVSTRYFAVDARGDSISINRGSLQLTYKWDEYSGGGKVTDVYQCTEVQI